MISALTSRLNFVLSMFGIDELPTCCERQELSYSQQVQQTVSQSGAMAGGSTSESAAASVTASEAVHSSVKSLSPAASFQGAVLSTVYKEKQMQQSRRKNFVVTGLPTSALVDDKTNVMQLCQKELNVSPEIISSRRLNGVTVSVPVPMFITILQTIVTALVQIYFVLSVLWHCLFYTY